MSLLGGITDAIGDVAGDALDLVESVGDLAGKVAPALTFANPAMALGLSSFSGAADVFGKITDDFLQQQEGCRPGRRENRGKGDKGDHGCEGGSSASGGGSIFEQIALAMGEAMDNKLQQLLQAADEVSKLSNDLAAKGNGKGEISDADKAKGQGDIMTASAQVTARSQELNMISQAFNSTINAVGQATSTAASKR